MSIFDMPVTCPTLEKAELCRRAGYRNVTVRPSQGEKRSRPAPASGVSRQPVRPLDAAREGEKLGRQWGHDAFGLARHLGINVSRAPLALLQRPERADSTIFGVLRVEPDRQPVVGLSETLNPHSEMWVLAHECGHFLGCESEDDADRFAASFMHIADDEFAGGKAKAFWDRLLAKEAARRRGRK